LGHPPTSLGRRLPPRGRRQTRAVSSPSHGSDRLVGR